MRELVIGIIEIVTGLMVLAIASWTYYVIKRRDGLK